MKTIFYDIETVANDRAHLFLQNKVYAAPANWKDPEKISAYIAEAQAKDGERFALHWKTGRIICISAETLDGWKFCSHGDSERDVISLFFTAVNNIAGNDFDEVRVVGKSSNDFDFPFIVGRALVNDLGLIPPFRPYARSDINEIFGGRRGDQTASLRDYALAFNLPLEKLGSGADVARWHAAGDWDQIIKYCQMDTHIVAEIWRRFERVYQ